MLNGLTLSALVNSGNTYLSAISLDIFLRLGFTKHDIQPEPDLHLETAKSSQTLKVLGVDGEVQLLRGPAFLRLGGGAVPLAGDVPPHRGQVRARQDRGEVGEDVGERVGKPGLVSHA